MGKKFILSTDTFAKKLSEMKPGSNGAFNKEVQLFVGTILEEVEELNHGSFRSLPLRSMDHASLAVTLSEALLTELNLFQVEILLPVSPIQERWSILRDRQWLREASVIMEGSEVGVDMADGSDPLPGIVRFCGTVPEIGKGILFGVELQGRAADCRACDGSIKGKQYFTTKSKCGGVFVAINRIRLQVQDLPDPKISISSNKLQPIFYEKALADGAPPPPLKPNDTVVWISDQTGPEYGVVRWLGKLPDVGNDWMVGVEFVNPVGSGTGKYNDHQLFETKFNHASLVPIIGLMKAEDFLGEKQQGTPPKPHRKKKAPDVQEKSFNQPAFSSLPREKKELFPAAGHSRSLSATSSDALMKGGCTRGDSSTESFFHVERSDCLNPLYLYEMNDKTQNGKTGTTRCDETFSLHSVPTSNGVISKKVLGNELEIGSVVEVSVNGVPCYGVIRWIGTIPDEHSKLVAGIEMEEENTGCTDGTFNGYRYFACPAKKAFFVRLAQCRKDARFLETEKRKSLVFGSIDCPSVVGHIPPLTNPEAMRALCGKNRGIQGHHNSCYLDATLFAMFSCTGVFDSILHRPAGPHDIVEYPEVQRVLKEEIVNPLRTNMYVRADRVMKLRTLMHELSSVSGLLTEEKDPEEFLNSLLNQIMKADPFLKLSSGQESYFYQLFVEKDEKLSLPTVQQLFDQSFLTSDIKLREIPPCLLIQMPRFGKQFKMYPRIVPSLYLDITDVLDDSPRQCSICGQVAEYECKECFGQFGVGLDSTAFCQKCIDKSHGHKKRLKHKTSRLSIPHEFSMLKEHSPIPRIYVELFAVLCIETSHYVAFVKCGSGPDAPWCFFDSMADRKGEQNGYNIPEVIPFQDLRWWLSEEATNFLAATKDDKVLPDIARRLLCDAYMCLYQSPDIMMYR